MAKRKKYKIPQNLYDVNSNQPDKLVETIDVTLNDDQRDYLLAHKDEPRTKLAQKLNITKLQLNQYLCKLFPATSAAHREKISERMKGNTNRKAI